MGTRNINGTVLPVWRGVHDAILQVSQHALTYSPRVLRKADENKRTFTLNKLSHVV